jgi:hypothetical protein
MRVFTRTVIDWNPTKKRYTVIAENSRLYFGPVLSCKGASSEQKDLAKSQTDFYNTLKTQQSAAFGQQQALYSAIRNVYDPIVAAGPNQYGFAGAEDKALRTQATEGTAVDYRAAEKATSEAMAARGGGNTFLPSGAEADIHARVAGAAAGQESSEQLGITKEGYNIGRQNFLNATGTEMGIATGYNPLGYAGAATNAGSSAFNMATEIQKANAAASPWGTIGGIIGGIAGGLAGNPAAIAGFLGNAGSGNKGPSSAPPPGINDPGFGGF